ncbi:hypothetical protein J6590_088521 [Homalodisca vitripennis]|nr:hypothetical protein J6590_088521 [Homalodisca vitripennis]
MLWGASANNHFFRAFKIQKQAIRIIAKMKFREWCKEAFKKLQLLTLPCLYILETSSFCLSKCALTRGRDIHEYETRGRDAYRTGRHRTGVYEHLPSQAEDLMRSWMEQRLQNTSIRRGIRLSIAEQLGVQVPVKSVPVNRKAGSAAFVPGAKTQKPPTYVMSP